MTLKPFGHLVLAERIQTTTTSLKIVLPESYQNRFWRIKIIDTGEEVNPGVVIGSECMANPIPQVDRELIDSEHPEWMLFNDHDILGRWDA